MSAAHGVDLASEETFEREARFLGFHPVRFVDDVINAMNDYVCDNSDALEGFLLSEPGLAERAAEVKQVRSDASLGAVVRPAWLRMRATRFRAAERMIATRPRACVAAKCVRLVLATPRRVRAPTPDMSLGIVFELMFLFGSCASNALPRESLAVRWFAPCDAKFESTTRARPPRAPLRALSRRSGVASHCMRRLTALSCARPRVAGRRPCDPTPAGRGRQEL